MPDPFPSPIVLAPWPGVSLPTPRFTGLFVSAAVAGQGIVQTAGRLAGPSRPTRAYFLSWTLDRAFSTGSLALVCIGLFLAVGLACGAAHPRRAWLLGFATVALFPVVVAIEIAADRSSHNLFPFELVMFAFLALPAVIGAAIGAGLRALAGRIGVPS